MDGRQRWDAHWNAMVRAAYRVLGDHGEAEECAAVALAQVYEQSPRGVLNAEAYLVTVAKRRAVDRLRVHARDRRRREALQAYVDDSMVDVAEDVTRQAEASWMAEQARRLLSDRSLQLLQRVADGHDVAQAARELGMTTASAHSHLHRSRKVLRAVYAKALAAVGVGWLGLKRSMVASPAVAAVVAVTVLTLPNTTPSPERGLPPTAGSSFPTPSSSPAVTTSLDVGVPVRRVTVTGELPLRRGVPSPSPSQYRPTPVPSPVAQASTPLGGSVRVEQRHEGTDEDEGVVGGALACLQNTQVTMEHIGC